MNQSNLSRRSLLKGAGALSAAAILAAYPGARLVRAQGNAEYDLIDLGPFETVVSGGAAPGPAGMLWGLNETGTVCGQIGVSETRFSPATWSSKGKLKRLKSGKLGGVARDVNDDAVVVGYEFESVDEIENRRPVAWRDGEPEDLPDLSGDTAGARGSAECINNDGVIAGSLRIENAFQAVRWIDGVAEALPDAPVGKAATVRAFNENGTIVASVSTGESGLVQTFGLWRGDDVVIIALPDEVTETEGALAFPQAVNGRDEVLFWAMESISDRNTWFFFTTDGDTTTVVDGRGDGISFAAIDLNDAGVVVGYTIEDDESRAALWEDGKFRYLDELIANGSGLTLELTSAINNAGMIAGSATDGDGVQHGYLLIPS